MISCAVALPHGTGSPRVNLFCVRVPVMSEKRMSTPASSSILSRRETIAFCPASRRAPTAMVIDSTAGMATGTEATSRISTKEEGEVLEIGFLLESISLVWSSCDGFPE
jgi:hypothetical protein